MGFVSPHAALATKKKKQSPHPKFPQEAHVESDRSGRMAELPFIQKSCAAAAPLGPQKPRAGVTRFSSSKRHHSLSHYSVLALDSKERASRPASTPKALDSRADSHRSLRMEQNSMSTEAMPAKGSPFIMPSSLRSKSLRRVKKEQSLKQPFMKVAHANSSNFIAQENRLASAEKIISRSANNKRALGRILTEGAADTTRTPYVPVKKVTILQRPKTREEALLNLSKLTGVSVTQLYAWNGLAWSSDNCETAGIANSVQPGNYCRVVGEALLYGKAFLAGEEDGSSGKVESTNSSRPWTVPSSAVEEQESSDVAGAVCSPHLQKEESLFVEKAPQLLHMPGEIKCYGLSDILVSLDDPNSLAEKWAAPDFAISPPPSSLPIPKFATSTGHNTKTPQKIESTHDLEGLHFSGLASAPASPSNEGGIWHIPNEEINTNILNTSVATKNLRRILQLNFQ